MIITTGLCEKASLSSSLKRNFVTKAALVSVLALLSIIQVKSATAFALLSSSASTLCKRSLVQTTVASHTVFNAPTTKTSMFVSPTSTSTLGSFANFMMTTKPQSEVETDEHGFQKEIEVDNKAFSHTFEVNHAVENKNDPALIIADIMHRFTGIKTSLGINQAAFVASIIIAALIALSPLSSLAAETGGRIGGDFGPSESSKTETETPSKPLPARKYLPIPSYGSTYNQGFRRGYGAGYYSSRPSFLVNPGYYSPFYNSPRVYPTPGVVVSSGPSLGVFAFGALAFVAALAATQLGKNNNSSIAKQLSSADSVGAGVSVAEISVALNVPNRDDPNSILNLLSKLSNTSRTDSRAGLQNLTSKVALELLRRKQSIVASSTKSQYYKDGKKAQREFSSLAIKERSKFERETVSKYGGEDFSDSRSNVASSSSPSQATLAVVTILVAIEGDTTKLPTIRTQNDVEESLNQIASDAKVGDYLQRAEILWTPEDRSETMSKRDVVADYPNLHFF